MPGSDFVIQSSSKRRSTVYKRHTHTAISTEVAVVAVLAIIIVALILVGSSHQPNTGTPSSQASTTQSSIPQAALSIERFQSSPLFSNQSTQITLTLRNKGTVAADNVVLTLISPAFNATTSPQHVDIGAVIIVPVMVKSHDIANGPYTATIIAKYIDSSGSQNINLGSVQVQVAPLILFTDLGWVWPPLQLTPKSTIGPNDNTMLHGKVKSLSGLAQYSDISIQVTILGEHEGLTVSPGSRVVSTIGPQGPSNETQFAIQSHNAPAGQYKVELTAVSYGTVVATDIVVLTVSAS